VGQGVLDQLGHVGVGQGVVEVRPVAAAQDQPFAAQQAQALGHGGELVAEGLDEFGDAAFAVHEEFEQAQTRGVAEGAEDASGAIEGGGGRFASRLGVVLVLASGNALGDGTPRCSVVSPTVEIIDLGVAAVKRVSAYFMEK
jgi:hypothetical protein